MDADTSTGGNRQFILRLRNADVHDLLRSSPHSGFMYRVPLFCEEVSAIPSESLWDGWWWMTVADDEFEREYGFDAAMEVFRNPALE
jgi:hypothetical protein